MQVRISVVDFGDLLLEKSADNPDCVRISMIDEPIFEDAPPKVATYFDLDAKEVRRLISGLDFISRHEISVKTKTT